MHCPAGGIPRMQCLRICHLPKHHTLRSQRQRLFIIDAAILFGIQVQWSLIREMPFTYSWGLPAAFPPS